MNQTAILPSSSKTASTPCFDRIAKPYRWLEYLSFGPLLQRTRIHWIPAVSHCRRALVLGDGDGRFTRALLSANPEIQVHAVDLSPAMLLALRTRCAACSNRLTTEAADLRSWQPASSTNYDLIATHFFLDCLSTQEAAALAERLTPALTPEAIWLVSDFAIPTTHYGRLVAAPIVAALYHAFARITCLGVRRLPDHTTALSRAGWQLGHEHTRARGLLFSQLWQRPKPTKSGLSNA